MPSPRRSPALLVVGVLALVLAALGAATTPSRAATAAPGLGERVDRFVADYLDRHRLPGASVAVVRDGTTVHLAGYGEDGDDQAVTPRTRFRVASVSKAFTAEVVRDLADAGRLDLDAPLVDVLPELALDDPRTDEITVRQLLGHTSGIVTPTIIGPADDLEAGVARLRDWTRPRWCS